MSTEKQWMIYLPADAATIISDRVEGCPDCIAEALLEAVGTEAGIYTECDRIAEALRKGEPFHVGELGRLILIDAADGNTFFARCEDWDRVQKMRWTRAANIAEARLSVLSVNPVKIPRS